jgi:hypothetical protein
MKGSFPFGNVVELLLTVCIKKLAFNMLLKTLWGKLKTSLNVIFILFQESTGFVKKCNAFPLFTGPGYF